MKISIIMPVFNVEQYLKRSIESIINQSYEKWELILVNDGSTDSSGKVCEFYAEQNSKILVIHQKNQGSGKARQKGLDSSTGTYVCFVDPDDFLGINALRHNSNIASQFNPDVVANGFFMICKKKNMKYLKEMKPILSGFHKQNEFRTKYKDYQKVGDRSLWNKIYKRSFLLDNSITFSELPVGQDAEFNYQVYTKLDSIYIDQNAFYYYDTLRNESSVKKYRKNRLSYEIDIIKTHKLMFNEWGMFKEYEYIYLLDLLNALFYEIINLTKDKSTLSNTEKRIVLQNHISQPIFKDLFNNLKVSQIEKKYKKVLFIILKSKNVNILLHTAKFFKY